MPQKTKEAQESYTLAVRFWSALPTIAQVFPKYSLNPQLETLNPKLVVVLGGYSYNYL